MSLMDVHHFNSCSDFTRGWNHGKASPRLTVEEVLRDRSMDVLTAICIVEEYGEYDPQLSVALLMGYPEVA